MNDTDKRIEEMREELERAKYVPGQLRCKKCGCSVVSRNLYMKSGTVGPDSKPKYCPNGCGPMWKITWPDHCKDYAKGMDKILDQERSKSKERDRYKKALEFYGNGCGGWINDLEGGKKDGKPGVIARKALEEQK